MSGEKAPRTPLAPNVHGALWMVASALGFTVMTTLIMAAILLFGIFAYRALPVSDLPNVDFPTVVVSATLPGADPDTMASAVATPLERQFSTIAGVDSMQADKATPLQLAPVGDKAVDLDFAGGRLSSDAGLVLLKDPDEQLGLTRALAAVLSDSRDARRVNFTQHDLLKQRVLPIAAGYEDANDANTLRPDPIFKLLLGRLPESGTPLA